MALYLMRRGESVLQEINPDRPLSDRVLVEVRHVAQQAAEKNIVITKILHGGRKRAMQTAMIVQEYLKPASGIAETAGINPKDDITNILACLKNRNVEDPAEADAVNSEHRFAPPGDCRDLR